jgi:AmmeMemoRadiSam system protein B
MQETEHSLEPIVSFLQRNNPRMEILPVLIPYMSFGHMKTHAEAFTIALGQLIDNRHLNWGRSFSIVISSDAVHYGDQGWGGRNFAAYGADTAGYKQATAHDNNLIDSYLTGPLSETKISKFFHATVQEANYKEYKWTWCGRYSIPFGLLTSVYLARNQQELVPSGCFVDYSTSIAHDPLPVKDIGMGHTAPATIHHWVGYATVGYK